MFSITLGTTACPLLDLQCSGARRQWSASELEDRRMECRRVDGHDQDQQRRSPNDMLWVDGTIIGYANWTPDIIGSSQQLIRMRKNR